MLSVVGVDPGKSGGVAKYDGTSLVTLEIPKAGKFVVWPELMDLLDILILPADHLFIEKVGARPDQGTVSMFNFGYATGRITGIFQASRTPITEASPSVWKPAMKVKADKSTSVIRIMELFPKQTKDFIGPRGGYKDGIAEAALIALYGYQKLTGIIK
jgi:crossover junction endodeoxyribonuclease RuvC